MKLSHVKINHFRSIDSLSMDVAQITTLIGKNSSGKSNILRAIQFFFTASGRSANPDDICRLVDDPQTWVECTFCGLTPEELDDLRMYVLPDDTIRIRRELRDVSGKYEAKLHGYVSKPLAAFLQVDYSAYADMEEWERLGIDVSAYAELGKGGKLTRSGHKTFCTEYISRHKDELETDIVLSSTQFQGRQSTASSVLPHVIFIPAVGDIVSEIYGKKSSLLNTMVAAVIESGRDLDIFEDANDGLSRAKDLINPSGSRLPRITNIETDIAGRLKSWPGTKVTIRTAVDDLAAILVDGLVLGVDDGHDTDLVGKGDGIQRQLLFQIFRLYADFRSQRGVFAPDEGESVVPSAPSVIIFEEPELFLHPQAQEAFYDDLMEVAQTDQVLLATHSSFLVRADQSDGLHVVRRSSMKDATRVVCAPSGWMDTGDAAALKQVVLLASDMSKIFFADRVLITEGAEDVVYLVGTARDHAKCIDRRISVVPAGSNSAIPTIQKLLASLEIPYTVACDQDPGNPVTAKHLATIRKLSEEANIRFGSSFSIVDVFDPDIPSVCTGSAPSKNKPLSALVYVRDSTPLPDFVSRVRSLFTLQDLNAAGNS